MRKLFFALMCLASLTIVTACGGGSNKSAVEGDSTESATGGGSLVDGKWPAAIYDKYGISASRITIKSFGDTVQPYKDNDRNRVVVAVAE